VAINDPNLISYTLSGLGPATYYLSMTAVNAAGLESARTAPVSKAVM